MSTPHDRLVAARKAAGYTTAIDAAAALGVSKDTYHQHENGKRAFNFKKAQIYARKFKVTPEHLLYGRESQEQLVPVIGVVGAASDGRVEVEQVREHTNFAPLPPGGSQGSFCLEVSGGSLPGIAEDGALIYGDDRVTKPGKDMLGRVVIVETAEGLVLLKRLTRGSERGRFDLESILGPTMEDVELKWAAHIAAIVPPHHAQKIIRRWNQAA